MEYRELQPIPALAPVVECLWTLEGHANDLGGESQPVLPDGRSELILHFGDAFERVRDGGPATEQAPLLFAGQLTSQLVLRPTGRISVLGIRFHPHGAAAVIGVPLHELSGLTLGLDDLSRPLAREMVEIRDRASDLTTAAFEVQSALAPLVNPHRIDARISAVVDAITRHRGRVSIDRLAASTGLTRRHLERQFRSHVGVSPKRLARIARFQHALRYLEDTAPGPRGTLTAAACGYADQAHFVRDFKDLAGCPPGEHLLRRGVLTGFFVGGGRGATRESGDLVIS